MKSAFACERPEDVSAERRRQAFGAALQSPSHDMQSERKATLAPVRSKEHPASFLKDGARRHRRQPMLSKRHLLKRSSDRELTLTGKGTSSDWTRAKGS